MPTGIKVIPVTTILPEQVLTHFGIKINDNNKCICPFHDETEPSMQVNESYVYCYGCKQAADVWGLAAHFLSEGESVAKFLRETKFASPSGRTYTTTKYTGKIPANLIDAWHVALLNNKEALRKLEEERLLSLNTVIKFKLGWRQDKEAFVIPFNYTETVQFRSTKTNDSGSKYWGLSGHSKGAILNQDILAQTHDYVVVLMGAFDAQLAFQDGLPAVGLNGSFPFKKTDKEWVQQAFKNQKIIYIVPDNNPEEIKAAHKLAEWIDGEVREFDADLPHNLDYIDYRKLGYTVEDFKRNVLGVLPFENLADHQLFPSLCSLYDVGNSYEFATVYCEMLARGVTWSDMAITLANKHITDVTSRRQMYNVKNKEDFIAAMGYNFKKQEKGAW